MAKTSEPNKKAKTSDDASIEGETDSGDVLSFYGESGEVYTLSGPPKAPDREFTLVRTPQADSPLVACVKKGLISFITEAGLNDVGHVITQANNIFALLQTMKADYGSFYDIVRAYIRHCLEWHSAEEERKRCETSEKAVDRYDSLLRHLDEMKKDVLVAGNDIERAKGYMSPLKPRLQDMKEMVEKLEIELEERVRDLRSLEARKVEKMKEMAAVDVELKATGNDAEKKRRMVRDNRARIEAARVCMKKVKNELKTM